MLSGASVRRRSTHKKDGSVKAYGERREQARREARGYEEAREYEAGSLKKGKGSRFASNIENRKSKSTDMARTKTTVRDGHSIVARRHEGLRQESGYYLIAWREPPGGPRQPVQRQHWRRVWPGLTKWLNKPSRQPGS